MLKSQGRFDWKAVEERWQNAWAEARLFEADPDPEREKLFVTFPFPYMNGPLHVGHAFTAARVDVYARFKRMKGFNVLFPWAWHWTGETIAGASERLRLNDQELIHALKEIDKVQEEEIKKFVDPLYMARYYTRESRDAVKRIGFSIDWRREFHTTSHDQAFSRFIRWQYEKLRKKGYVIKGTHPVVWCPKCESPTGEADRLVGEDVAPEEYVLIKFRLGNLFFPGATFRPETVYGVTNLWLNPESMYVEANVDGEKWIVSEDSTKKLREQLRRVKIVRRFEGREVVGKFCKDPVSGRDIPILPGWFVKPESATGVVYSVPAHAPYDWLALRDLKSKPEELRKFGIDPVIIDEVEPISMIRLDGFGEFPALEVVDAMKIVDQNDPKAEEATEVIYKKEFHTGVLKEICGKYAGREVSEVKEQLIQDFKKRGIADVMYDLPEPVVCRCTTSCIVKVLADQWFLRYSDERWKEKARDCLSRMKLYPENVRKWFEDIVGWLREKACARRTGLGTPMPWTSGWMVETLSDSTIYMAYYTVSRYINKFKIDPEKLTEKVFDYIYYGEGDPEKTGIDLEVLMAMRREFLYWYPVDLRISAKELVPNHLTFFIFHHVALFPQQHWPKAIGANGVLTIEGEKMSKSKGNFVTLKNAVESYGADPTRCALILSAEEMEDPDWRSENIRDINAKLASFYDFSKRIYGAKGKEAGSLESWLLSVLQRRIKAVSDGLENLRTRTALENALFETWNDFKWYMRRTREPNAAVLREALRIWVRLMGPFAPHVCEQIWSEIGEKEFVSNAVWPSYDEDKIDVKSEEAESLVKSVLEDTINILKATGIKPSKVVCYTTSGWKWKVYQKALELCKDGKIEVGKLMKTLMADRELKIDAERLSSYSQKLVKQFTYLHKEVLERQLTVGIIDEYEVMRGAIDFYEREFKADVEVYEEEDPKRYDPKDRARLAEPHRPAIFVE